MRLKYLNFILPALFVVFLGCDTGCNTGCDCDAGTATKANEILQIEITSSFGECLGYCTRTMSVDPQIITLTQSGRPAENYPEMTEEMAIPPQKWARLLAELDTDTFNALPEVVGCPDCADGGAETIVITTSDGVRDVSIEFGTQLEGLESFLTELRDLKLAMFAQTGWDENQNESDETPLEDTNWILAGYQDNSGNVTEVSRSWAATISFDQETGVAGGRIVCNSFSTTYQISGQLIFFGDIISTQMLCEVCTPTECHPFEEAQDKFVSNVLTNIDSYSIQNDTLQLQSKSGEILTYVVDETI